MLYITVPCLFIQCLSEEAIDDDRREERSIEVTSPQTIALVKQSVLNDWR